LSSFFNHRERSREPGFFILELHVVAEKVLFLCKNIYMSADKGRTMGRIACLAILLSLAPFSISCGRRETPFDRFRQELDRVVTDVEGQNLSRLSEMLHPDFIDQQGRDAGQVLDWLERLLKTRRDVVVHLLDIDEIISPTSEEDGRVDIDLVVSSGGLKLVRKLVSVYGRLVRLKLGVEGDDFWGVTSAEWQEDP